MQMATTELVLDCALSVNEIVARFPETIDVFNRFGLDMCCGGSRSVTESARQEGVDREALCEALHAAVPQATVQR
jgi:regulator of cell morphogenesis and NO signaling